MTGEQCRTKMKTEGHLPGLLNRNISILGSTEFCKENRVYVLMARIVTISSQQVSVKPGKLSTVPDASVLVVRKRFILAIIISIVTHYIACRAFHRSVQHNLRSRGWFAANDIIDLIKKSPLLSLPPCQSSLNMVIQQSFSSLYSLEDRFFY